MCFKDQRPSGKTGMELNVLKSEWKGRAELMQFKKQIPLGSGKSRNRDWREVSKAGDLCPSCSACLQLSHQPKTRPKRGEAGWQIWAGWTTSISVKLHIHLKSQRALQTPRPEEPCRKGQCNSQCSLWAFASLPLCQGGWRYLSEGSKLL